jgi:S-DNA-T family DNA segregation ATPase FtsK/SpoIIIE
MARPTSAAAGRSRSKARPTAAASEPIGLELIGLGLGLASLLLLAALVTQAPSGTPGAWHNAVGALGRGAAGALTAALGLGALVAPVLGIAWAIACLRGQAPRRWGLKAALLPVAMALVAVLASLLLKRMPGPGLERFGPGGYFGLSVGTALFDTLGPSASLVSLAGLLAIAALVGDLSLSRVGTAVAGAVGRAAAKARRRAIEDDEDELEEDGTEAEEEGDWEYEDDEEAEGEDEGEWESEYEDDEDGEWEEAEDTEDPAAQEAAARREAARKRREVPPAPREKKSWKPKGKYVPPPLDLLAPGHTVEENSVKEEVDARADTLEETLRAFRIEAKVVSYRRGPVITFYEVQVPPGVAGSQIAKRADDIGRALKVGKVRVVTNMRGLDTIGIEVGNEQRDDVTLRDLLEESGPKIDRLEIPLLLGRDTSGRPIVEDLAKMPHCLIAGATGAGKSVCINSILQSILFTRGPEEVSMILIDPKQVELAAYEGIPHLATAVETDPKRAGKLLQWAVERMEERYHQLKCTGTRNIKGYNDLPAARRASARERHGVEEEALPDRLPYIVIVVDEMADLIMTGGKDVELAITRLAQKSRAVGIHLILATQRPERTVITGLIKANMPTRIAFTVSSKLDSRVVLDQNGAETLLGMGDLLFLSPRSMFPIRGQGALVTDEEVLNVVADVKSKYPDVEYQDLLKQQTQAQGDPMVRDDLYNDAVRLVLGKKLGSASMLQRCMGIGYTRASRLIEMMEEQGVVGPHQGSKARELYVELDEWEADLASRGPAEGAPSAEYDHEEPPAVDTSWD